MRKLRFGLVGLLVLVAGQSEAASWRDVLSVFKAAETTLPVNCFLWVSESAGTSSGTKWTVKKRCGGSELKAVDILFREFATRTTVTGNNTVMSCNGTTGTENFFSTGGLYSPNYTPITRSIFCSGTSSEVRGTLLGASYSRHQMCWVGSTTLNSCTGLDSTQATIDNAASNDCSYSVVEFNSSIGQSSMTVGSCACIPERYVPIQILDQVTGKCRFTKVTGDPGTVGGLILNSPVDGQVVSGDNGVNPVPGEIGGLPVCTVNCGSGGTGPGGAPPPGGTPPPGEYTGPGGNEGGITGSDVQSAVAAAIAASNLSRLTQGDVSAGVASGMGSYGAAKGSDISGGVSGGLSSYGAAKGSDIASGVSAGIEGAGLAKGSDIGPGVSSGLTTYGAAKGSDIPNQGAIKQAMKDALTEKEAEIQVQNPPAGDSLPTTYDGTPEEQSVKDLVTGFLGGNPLVAVITGSGVTASGTCSVSTSLWGQTVALDFCPLESYLSAIGVFIVAFAGLLAVFIVFAG